MKMKSPRFKPRLIYVSMTFQPKIFRLKMMKFQIFVEIGRWPESTKDNLPPIFWTFLVVPKNVHFALCAWKF